MPLNRLSYTAITAALACVTADILLYASFPEPVYCIVFVSLMLGVPLVWRLARRRELGLGYFESIILLVAGVVSTVYVLAIILGALLVGTGYLLVGWTLCFCAIGLSLWLSYFLGKNAAVNPLIPALVALVGMGLAIASLFFDSSAFHR